MDDPNSVMQSFRKHAVLVNAVVGQALWFVCVIGGVAGLDFGLLAAVIVLVVAQVRLAPSGRSRLVAQILLVTCYGVWQDTFLTRLGVFEPMRGEYVPFPWTPIWLVALWLNFASMTAICLRRLRGKPWLVLLAGAVGGPMAYAGGVRFGAIAFTNGMRYGIGVLAVAWALGAWFALCVVPELLLIDKPIWSIGKKGM